MTNVYICEHWRRWLTCVGLVMLLLLAGCAASTPGQPSLGQALLFHILTQPAPVLQRDTTMQHCTTTDLNGWLQTTCY